MKGKCCKCGKVKEVLFFEQIERETLVICHDCIKAERIQNLKYTSVYALIMSYPFSGIPRSEKHRLCEWLMVKQGDI